MVPVRLRSAMYWVGAYLVLFVLLIATDLLRLGTVPPLWDSPVVLYSSLAIGLIGVLFREWNIRISLPALALGALLGLATGGTLAMFVFLFEAFFVATLNGSPRVRQVAQVAAVALSILTVGAAWAVSQEFRYALLVAMQSVLTYWLPIEWADNIRKERELAELEKARTAVVVQNAEQERELAVSRERNHMATELHDTVSGNLSAIALQSQAALAAPDGAARAAILGEIRRESVEALAHMRSMVAVLASRSQPEPVGGLADLETLASRARAAGHDVTLCVGEVPELPRLADAGVYRIASEAVTNAMKHAPGSPISVSVRSDGERVELQVRNRVTPGARSGDAAGQGLANMRVRAEQLGARLSAGPEGADEWRVRLVVPGGVA